MMKKIIVLFFFPFTVFTQTLTVQSPIRFLALGDSYTIGQNVSVNQRWPMQLRDSLAVRGFTVDTMCIIATTGWRTDNLLNAITNKQLEKQHYNLVSVLIGVNNQYQNKPISQYMSEFPQLLDSAILYAGGDTSHVFIVSIPDYAYTSYGQSTGNQTQISQEIDQYNAINKHFADSLHIRYFDITPISRLGIVQPNLVASDGLHPSGLQYSQWVKLMLQYIDGTITTSVKENKNKHDLLVYPNPANEMLTITYLKNKMADVELYNSAGQLVVKQKLKNGTTTVSLKGLSKGVYSIHLFSEGKMIMKKVVKE